MGCCSSSPTTSGAAASPSARSTKGAAASPSSKPSSAAARSLWTLHDTLRDLAPAATPRKREAAVAQWAEWTQDEAAFNAFLSQFQAARVVEAFVDFVVSSRGDPSIKALVLTTLDKHRELLEGAVQQQQALSLLDVFVGNDNSTDVRSGAAVVLLHQLRQPRCETVQHLVTNNALTVLLEVCQGMLQSPAMRAFAAKILTRLIADNPPAARQLLKLRNSLSIILRLVNNIDADLLIATEGVALLLTLLQVERSTHEALVTAGAQSMVVLALVDLLRHVLSTYGAVSPVTASIRSASAALSPRHGAALAGSAEEAAGPVHLMDHPAGLVAVEAARVMWILARRRGHRAALVRGGGAQVLVQLMQSEGVHADKAHTVAAAALGLLVEDDAVRASPGVWDGYLAAMAKRSLRERSSKAALLRLAKTRQGRLRLLRHSVRPLVDSLLNPKPEYRATKRDAARLLWTLAAETRPQQLHLFSPPPPPAAISPPPGSTPAPAPTPAPTPAPAPAPAPARTRSKRRGRRRRKQPPPAATEKDDEGGADESKRGEHSGEGEEDEEGVVMGVGAGRRRQPRAAGRAPRGSLGLSGLTASLDALNARIAAFSAAADTPNSSDAQATAASTTTTPPEEALHALSPRKQHRRRPSTDATSSPSSTGGARGAAGSQDAAAGSGGTGGARKAASTTNATSLAPAPAPRRRRRSSGRGGSSHDDTEQRPPEIAQGIGNDAAYRELHRRGALATLLPRSGGDSSSAAGLLFEADDVVLFCCCAAVAEGLRCYEAAADARDELIEAARARRHASSANSAKQQGGKSTVSAGNPLFLARAADEEARAMARAQALWDERYTLPAEQVQQARQFLKAGVRVLEESTRRRERAKLGAEAALREQDEAMSAVTSVAPSDAGHPFTAGAGAGSARAASGRALLFAHEAAAAVQSVAGFSMASTSARSLTTTQARALDATQARFGASVQLGIVWSRPLLDRLAHYVESQYPEVIALAAFAVRDAVELAADEHAQAAAARLLRRLPEGRSKPSVPASAIGNLPMTRTQAAEFLVTRGMQWRLRTAHATVKAVPAVALLPPPAASSDVAGGAGAGAGGSKERRSLTLWDVGATDLDRFASNGSSSPPPPPPPPPADDADALPEHWTAVTAPDGRLYYWNRLTGTTTWTRPQPPAPQQRKAATVSPPPLPTPTPTVSDARELIPAVAQTLAYEPSDWPVRTVNGAIILLGLGEPAAPSTAAKTAGVSARSLLRSAGAKLLPGGGAGRGAGAGAAAVNVNPLVAAGVARTAAAAKQQRDGEEEEEEDEDGSLASDDEYYYSDEEGEEEGEEEEEGGFYYYSDEDGIHVMPRA